MYHLLMFFGICTFCAAISKFVTKLDLKYKSTSQVGVKNFINITDITDYTPDG